jgi:hypothetical protein
MLFTNTSFIGIDPTAGQRPFTYAALDNDCQLLAIGQGSLEDVLAFVAGQSQCIVSVCAPRQPNQGIMARPEVRENLSPSPRPGRWTNFRLVEYLLCQHNITVPQTRAQVDSCPNWMKMGFILHNRLVKLGYQVYPSSNGQRQSMEVYPHASYTTILEKIPLPKNSLEGRIQRQLALYDQKINLPDPMRMFEEITRHRLLQGILPVNDLCSPGELDALVGAYTAWLAATKPDQITLLGDPDEGQIVLPVPELKAHY